MKTNFNPALSFGTTNVIPIKSSKSERVVNYTGNDSFMKSNHADVAFGGMKNVGSKAKLTLFAFLMSMFSGCVHVPEGNPNRMAEFYAKDAKGMFYALKDSITGGFKFKSATENLELTYKDWVSSCGQKNHIVINPETKVGTSTLDDGFNGVWDAALKKSDSGKGIKFEYSLDGEVLGSETWDLTGPVSEGGLHRFIEGEVGVYSELHPVTSDSLSATLYENGNILAQSGIGGIK